MSYLEIYDSVEMQAAELTTNEIDTSLFRNPLFEIYLFENH